jgi:hypothetical protein
MVPNSPGVRNMSLFSTEARARIVPVAWSTRLSTKSRTPLRVGSFSSVSLIRTGSCFFLESAAEPIWRLRSYARKERSSMSK